MTIFDTDIIIDFLKGKQETVRYFVSTPRHLRYITIVNLIELYQGAQDKKHLKTLKRFVEDTFTGVLTLSPASSQLAVQLVEQHALSIGLRLADALVAAVAMQEGAVLLSGNARHFKAIAKLKLQIPDYKATS